jgi:hypothetical protein
MYWRLTVWSKNLFAEIFVLLEEVPGYSIDKGAGIVAAGRMDDQPRRLVDDHDVFVLVHDVER